MFKASGLFCPLALNIRFELSGTRAPVSALANRISSGARSRFTVSNSLSRSSASVTDPATARAPTQMVANAASSFSCLRPKM